MNILFLGSAIFPFPISGDKNFILQLAQELKYKDISVYILSINDNPLQYEYINNIHFFYLRRFLHNNSYKKHTIIRSKKIVSYRHKHNIIRENIEIFFTILDNIKRIKRIIKRYRINIIHILDNIGISFILLSFIFKEVKIVSTVYRYQKKGLLYNKYLKIGYGSLSYLVFTTKKTKEIFNSKKIFSKNGYIIPWGVKKLDCSDIYESQNDSYSLLWSGFIQQIGEEEFYLALDIANDLIKRNKINKIDFVFKPESHEKKYSLYNNENINIKIGDINFRKNLKNYDYFLCPISYKNSNSTFAPPLTWIECWSYGIPVLTTKFLGYKEIIKDAINGFVFDYSNIAENIYQKIINNDILSIRKSCVKYFNEKYEMDIIAKKYIKFYKEIINGK